MKLRALSTLMIAVQTSGIIRDIISADMLNVFPSDVKVSPPARYLKVVANRVFALSVLPDFSALAINGLTQRGSRLMSFGVIRNH